MSEAKITVGSFANWLLSRCISLIILVAGLILTAANLHRFQLQFFCMGMLLSIIGVMGSHDLIYGVADEEGIHYRQYLTQRLLKWEHIATISWTNAYIIHFHIKGTGRSRTILSAQSFGSKSWAQLYSEEPELIRWLTLVKPTAADGIEVRDPAASMPALLGKNPLAASRILQFILVLIVVILILSMIYARR
jgi:hypothetical protein